LPSTTEDARRHVAEARDRAYLKRMNAAVPADVAHDSRAGRRAVVVLAAAAGLLLASTLLLWAHYGTAVFYEMIAAGVAACL
jgi:hypothetical protein